MNLKNIFQFGAITLMSIIITSSCFAQEKKIDKKNLPKAVVESFQKTYPNAVIKGTSTEKEHGKTYYEIESIDGTRGRDLLYAKDGKIAEIEEALAAENIPDFIKNSVMKKYPKSKIHKVEKLTKGNKISFEAVVEHDGKKSEVVLDSKGNIQKMGKMKKGNEEKEEKESKKENEENDED